MWLDNTNEALAGLLRPGNAGSNTAADHVEVIDAGLAQIPGEHRYGAPILVRADGAGCSKAWLARGCARAYRRGGPVLSGQLSYERTVIIPAAMW